MYSLSVMKSRQDRTKVEFECSRNRSRQNGSRQNGTNHRRNGRRRNGSDSFILLYMRVGNMYVDCRLVIYLYLHLSQPSSIYATCLSLMYTICIIISQCNMLIKNSSLLPNLTLYLIFHLLYSGLNHQKSWSENQ